MALFALSQQRTITNIESQTQRVPQLQKARGAMRRNHMNRAKELLTHLLNDDSGQDLIEYALVASILALCAVASEAALTNKIANEFNMITSHF